jgi:hypothetical protein
MDGGEERWQTRKLLRGRHECPHAVLEKYPSRHNMDSTSTLPDGWAWMAGTSPAKTMNYLGPLP